MYNITAKEGVSCLIHFCVLGMNHVISTRYLAIRGDAEMDMRFIHIQVVENLVP
jgi:hypothetical protein